MEGLGTKTTLSDYLSILFLLLVLDLESIGLSFLYFFLQRGLPFIGSAHMCPEHCISVLVEIAQTQTSEKNFGPSRLFGSGSQKAHRGSPESERGKGRKPIKDVRNRTPL